MWSTGEGNGKPLQYFCLENSMNSMKRQKDRTPKDELPRSVGKSLQMVPATMKLKDICSLEKTLESPLDCKEIKVIHPKGN